MPQAAPAAPGKTRHGHGWWRRQLLTECCPITLEPLRALRYPPFELHADPSLSHRTDGDWFDGKMLAAYLVSTGRFQHPISRRSLTASDCSDLDKYLQRFGLGKPQVGHAFAHQATYAGDAGGATAGSSDRRLARLRAEADGVLRALFAAPENEGGRRTTTSAAPVSRVAPKRPPTTPLRSRTRPATYLLHSALP